ncbi:hypothetical protein ACFXGA_13095 [Actinosynnema sp. NPDC059335]|uniref:hypothetical protein n=1 Tax=Actinosynnema sp. NPDC059335 TaxID=3346804 RepID=UPI00366C5EC5
MTRFSLRARLLLLTAGLLLVGLVLVGAVVADQLERYQLGRIDAQLRSFTEIIDGVSAQGRPRCCTGWARCPTAPTSTRRCAASTARRPG